MYILSFYLPFNGSVTGGYYALLKADKISLCPDGDAKNASILLTSYNDIREKWGIKLEYVYIENRALLHNGAFPPRVIEAAKNRYTGFLGIVTKPCC